MTAQSAIQTTLYSRAITSVRTARRAHRNIRKDLLIIRLMIATGLVLPLLMVSDIIYPSFLLVGISFGLLVVGAVMSLIRCGEVA